jgi:flagellar basal body-associated protein FliL
VAEDKKKEGDAKGDEGKKKKGLPPIVLIAVGAIVGGAGVVFAVPPKTVQPQQTHEPSVPPEIDVLHPDPLKKTFNPRTKAGKGTARIEFKFVYTVRKDLEADAFTLIKENWEQANSDALMLLKRRSMEELNSDTGMRMLEKDLIEELDRALFGKPGTERVATVTRVLLVDLLVQ